MLHITLGPTPHEAKITDRDGNDLMKAVAIRDIEVRASANGLAQAAIFVEMLSAQIQEDMTEWRTKHPVTGT